jgi:hypothetical protein
MGVCVCVTDLKFETVSLEGIPVSDLACLYRFSKKKLTEKNFLKHLNVIFLQYV